MKKIYGFFITFSLIFSMITFIGGVNADDPMIINCNPSYSSFNWTTIDDFFDVTHGYGRIHGSVFGYYDYDSEESTTRPLRNASVSIRLVNPESNNLISEKIDIPTVVPIPDWDTKIDNPWISNDNLIEITEVEDILTDLIDINFSTYVKPSSVKKFNSKCTAYEEIHVATNPYSSIDNIRNLSWTRIVHFWRHDFTDENGEYEFNFLQPGTYELKAHKMGYESVTKTITIDDGSAELNFILNATGLAYIIEEVLQSENFSFENVSDYFRARVKIDNEKGKNIGCSIVVNKNIGNKVEIYHNGLTINATNITDNKISIKINGDEDLSGKTIEIQVHGEVFYDIENLIIEYDGGGIRMADDLDDVLNPDDDGSNPEYWIVYDVNGTHIIISIPHFSEHIITVYSLSPAISAPTAKAATEVLLVIAVYIVICTIAAIIFIGSISLRKRLR